MKPLGGPELPSEPEWVRRGMDGLTDRTRGLVLAALGAFGVALLWLLVMLGYGFRETSALPLMAEAWRLATLASAASLVYGLTLLISPPPPPVPDGDRMAGLLLEQRRRALWARRLMAAAAGVVHMLLMMTR